MSEEKLYAIKNDEGEYCDFDDSAAYKRFGTANRPFTRNDIAARDIALTCHGHVVTFVEEPEKVVITEEQAKVVKYAHSGKSPASNIAFSGNNDEKLLMNAYVNGYTVAKEKKYNVKVPYAEGWHFQKYSSASKLGARNNWRPFPAKDIDSNMSKELFQFTESEINHYGLQDCEKEEVTDDGTK